MRKLGSELPGLSPKKTERPALSTGTAWSGAQEVVGVYALRLMEKQKVRYNYGVSERQLRHLIARGEATAGATATS